LHFVALHARLGHASFILLIPYLLLRIRLTRTGKTRQISYRIAVAEHTAPIQSKFVEIVGHYNVSRNPRELVVDQDRVTYWIAHGAQPTSTVASLFKKMGMKDMDSFIIARKSTKKKKKEGTAGAEPSAAKVTEAPAAPAEAK
jgi:small subunit ribosomal protein S16